MKRWIAALLTLVMMVSVVPFGAVAESDVGQALAKVAAEALEQENGTAVATGTCGDNLTWSLSDDGTLTISGTGEMDDYNIPESSNKSDIPWWDYRLDITTIVIDSHIAHIGNNSFRECKKATSILIPNGIISIGDYAFVGCDSMITFDLPESVTSIGQNAFSSCSSLSSIIIPSNVTFIGEYAFYNCTALVSIKLPDSITSIEPYAFALCSHLESITIPVGITTISAGLFYGCSSLYSIEFPTTVTSIGTDAFYNCHFTSLVLPSSITSIGERAFAHCTSLASIMIPSSVISIGADAFFYCTALTSVSIPASMTSIERNVFYYCSNLKSIIIPKSIAAIGSMAFYACSSLQDVYYAGTQEQWGSISISQYNNEALTNATIHYLSTGPESEKTFTFKQDNLRFLNNQKYFCEQERTPLESFFNWSTNKYIDAGHPVSNEKFDLLTKNYVPRAKKVMELCRASSWHGSCYGMSTVVAIHYVSPTKLPFSAQSPYYLSAPVNDKTVESLINYYHIMQYTPTMRKVLGDRRTLCKDSLEEPLSEIVDELYSGYPVLTYLYSETEDTHVILLLDILEETPEYYKIRVYDPNKTEEDTLDLYKTRSETTETNCDFLPISYGNYECVISYLLCKRDLQYLDLRNYYGIGDNEKAIDYDDNFVVVNSDYTVNMKWGRAYYRASNNKLVEYSDGVTVVPDGATMADGTFEGNIWISIPAPTDSSVFEMETTSSDTGMASILLDNTLLSISTSGPVKLTYNEDARTVDVTAENPTDVNLLFTQNTPDEAWPWNTWAIDTTNTTKLHANLDEDGLHLTGDGISGAKVATEKVAEDESSEDEVAAITLPAKAEGETTQEVTISNKKDETTNDDKLTIDGSDSGNTDPSEPSKPGTPTTPTNPTAPSGGSGSGDGDSGAGALLLVGGAAAAAAITAGVVLSMPVEIQGKVELADHTPLAGAKIALLKDGKVVEQTTTDAAGAFSVKVKRGEYQLTAAYTNADGQIIHQTVNVKAPAKDLTITF